ncbi:hypothetical protein R5R35_008544 [Gryllus longicercus]|uniref:glutathione-specific gamma-glutamylcyclotransferase n=1 Tax=Gryllus longicercus TaxID=2509291 RepID=A0AAN9VML1_9ORTH|nr:Gamma-glutamylcyclotransferase [Gryllus bimaculatus]
MWIFGYGSLVWKVDFPYKARVVGYIKGYIRRFWQSSEDHRGVPGKPGRVVTLLPASDPEAQVWGVAYEIAKENEELVMNHLDYREKDGYDKVSVMFYPKASDDGASTVAPFELFIYVGSEQNKFFAGPADVNSIAKQVVSAVGPSGTNSEYVLQLALAMRKLAPGIVDDHLFSLEEAVKHLQNEKGEPNVNS